MTASKPEAPQPEVLGRFEQYLLTAVMALGGEAYGVPIYDKVCALSEKRVNLGSLYLTLEHTARYRHSKASSCESADRVPAPITSPTAVAQFDRNLFVFAGL